MLDSSFSHKEFDFTLAVECAKAYSASSGLGCMVSDTSSRVLFEVGAGCASCGVCAILGIDEETCIRGQGYGMVESVRFGGKYIYFCPMGLTCFISPIMGESETAANITVGPFLMVDVDDYADIDLRLKLKLGDEAIRKVLKAVEEFPYVSSDRVDPLSKLLFMAVGFINNVSSTNRMLKTQESGAVQSNITQYVTALKMGELPPAYPYKTEKSLIASIADFNKIDSQRHLNELLGYIVFSSGGDFARMKARIFELLGIMSRCAIDAGASTETIFNINQEFFIKAGTTAEIDELSILLSDVMNKYIDSIFELSNVKNADVIRKAIHYMRNNYTRKLVLDDVASEVCLCPAYFSKIFRREMGSGFNTYLNMLRVEKSKVLLTQSNMPLIDIAFALGFEDQSYFSKVFKRLTGMSPLQYKKSGGKPPRSQCERDII